MLFFKIEIMQLSACDKVHTKIINNLLSIHRKILINQEKNVALKVYL